MNSDDTERADETRPAGHDDLRFQTLFESIPDAIMLIERETGAILDVNGAACTMYGYGRSELLSMKNTDISAEPEATRETTVGEVYYVPLRYHRRKDGTAFPVELRISRFDYGGRGVNTVAVRDISERLRIEEEARRANLDLAAVNERYQKVVENASDLVLIIRDGVIHYSNPMMSEIIGYDRTEVEGRSFLDFVHPDDRAPLVERYMKNLDGERFPRSYDYRIFHKSGEERFVMVKGTAIELKGKPAMLYFISDITERKRAEELLKTGLAEKEILLKEIHHRVKNNMQVISSLLSLQVDTLDDPAVRDALRASQNRVKSMALIHEHLYQSKNLSKIDFGEYTVSLVRTIMNMYPAGRVKTEVSVHDIHLDIDRAIPCGLIINELVTNCVKHAFPEGRGGRIEVLMHGTEEGRYELVVADDGVGGFEDERSTSSLGMRLIKSLVTQLKGRIWIDSTAGTRIRILF